MLADQGATVIIIKSSTGTGLKFDMLSRGKSAITLNLKKDKDRAFLI